MAGGSSNTDLLSVGLASQCNNLCQTGRKLKNVGRVRLQVMVNDYCPFSGMRQQDETFQFDSSTFGALPKSVASRVRLPGDKLDGIHLRENFILRSNLMFVKANQSTGQSGGSSQTSPDQVVEEHNYTLGKIWDNGAKKSKEGHEYVPHYAWTHTGSLYTNEVIQPNEYINGSGTSSGASTSTPKVNLAKWSYKTANSPVATQNSVDAQGNVTAGTASSPDILFPLQNVAGTLSESRSMHWTCEKRRPVFQGADWFVLVHRISPESTVQGVQKPMLDQYKPLDSRLSNATGPDGELINGGVVETDNTGQVIEDSRNLFDLNNQTYFMIELGQGDPSHNYFILLAEKTFPTFLHVGTAAVAVRNSDGSVRVVSPSEPVSRRLSMYEGVLSSELLKQEKLMITCRNYMGRLVITFSGYENNPWVIERRDLISTGLANQSDTQSNGGSNNSDYVETTIPCVVPPAKMALHGGNYKVAFNWGYMKYEPLVSFRMPQTIHIEGTQSAQPQMSDITLRFRGFTTQERVPNPMNDVIYNHDALKFADFVNGSKVETTAMNAQQYSYSQYGKGCVPNANSNSNSSSTSNNGGFQWPTQNQATPQAKMSSISVTADNMRSINGENRSKEFDVWVTMRAGSFTFKSDPENTVEGDIEFINVMTPICSGYKMAIAARGCSFQPQAVDVSPWVAQFSETWTSQDYVRIEHSGTLRFLLNEGMNAVYANPNANYQNGQQPNTQPWPPVQTVPDKTDYIASLVDKTFYVRIKAWYEQSGVFPSSQNNQNAYIFTGLCHGGKLSYENNRRTMECHVHDLSKILQDQFFLNSPYYDAVRDYVAVRDILRQATFLSTTQCSGTVAPASFVASGATKAQSSSDGTFSITYMDGGPSGASVRSVTCRAFALPGSYDRLQQPVFRFKDGDKFMDAIVRMANVAGKQVYFDRFGLMHYEDRIDTLLIAGILSESQVVQNGNLIKERFYASPRLITNGSPCDSYGQIAYNSYTWERLAGDVVNQIMVISVSPDGAPLVGGDKKYDLIDNPSAPGFLGYPKQFLQMNGIFGSGEAVRSVVENYTTMYKPPLRVSFETFGRSYLKALDLITFVGLDSANNANGEPQPLRITNISTEIVPEKNTWWSKIDCEWMYTGDGVNWGSN